MATAAAPAPRALRARRGRSGFTLIEMLAVVLLMGLVAAMAYPSLNLGGRRAVREEAEEIASAVEFARQRAVMTGRAHQVELDLTRGFHHVEWAEPAPPGDAGGAAAAADSAGGAAAGTLAARRLELVPPGEEERFVPVPGPFGRGRLMDEEVWILAVDVGGVVREEGQAVLRMSPDGSTDPTHIRVGDPDQRQVYAVEVLPLADAARVVADEAPR